MQEPRAPRVAPETMTPEQRALVERFTTGPRADPANAFRLTDETGQLIGPLRAWVLAPELGLALEPVGAQMRWGIHVSGRAREAVILAVGYAEASPFELYAHEAAGRAEGLTEEDLADLRAGRTPAGADEELRIAHGIALELIRDRTLSEETFGRAVAALGHAVVFELVVLVGWYQMTTLVLATFDIQPPPAVFRTTAEPAS